MKQAEAEDLAQQINKQEQPRIQATTKKIGQGWSVQLVLRPETPRERRASFRQSTDWEVLEYAWRGL
jgi:hypothetical protein